MKLFFVCLAVALVAVNADPIEISGNTIGDIVAGKFVIIVKWYKLNSN